MAVKSDDGAARGIHPYRHDVGLRHTRLVHRLPHGLAQSVPPIVGILLGRKGWFERQPKVPKSIESNSVSLNPPNANKQNYIQTCSKTLNLRSILNTLAPFVNRA